MNGRWSCIFLNLELNQTLSYTKFIRPNSLNTYTVCDNTILKYYTNSTSIINPRIYHEHPKLIIREQKRKNKIIGLPGTVFITYILEVLVTIISYDIII
jgi:hypothetical protein